MYKSAKPKSPYSSVHMCFLTLATYNPSIKLYCLGDLMSWLIIVDAILENQGYYLHDSSSETPWICAVSSLSLIMHCSPKGSLCPGHMRQPYIGQLGNGPTITWGSRIAFSLCLGSSVCYLWVHSNPTSLILFICEMGNTMVATNSCKDTKESNEL